MNDKPLFGSEQFVGNDKGTDGVIAGPAASIPNHVGVPPRLGRRTWPDQVEHPCTSESRTGRRRQGESPLGPKIFNMGVICSEDFIEDFAHTQMRVGVRFPRRLGLLIQRAPGRDHPGDVFGGCLSKQECQPFLLGEGPRRCA